MAASSPTEDLSFPRPLTTVDLAIFAVAEEALHVLLMKRTRQTSFHPGAWALPGGFVRIDEDADLEHCARRTLKTKTGVDVPYLEQVGSWGGARRDPRGWSATHLYMTLLPNLRDLMAGGNADDTKWFPVKGERVGVSLAFDHTELLKAAITRLRDKVEYTSLPAFLMPGEFTLTDLQHVYEIVLGRDLEKKAFRTRILATDLVEEVSGRTREGQGRPAQLYRLRSRRRPIYFSRAFSGPRS
jgi:ADP-ribose pyrophosphatase YjhB (NUDIX family)